MHVRQPVIAAGVAVGEARVVEAGTWRPGRKDERMKDEGGGPCLCAEAEEAAGAA